MYVRNYCPKVTFLRVLRRGRWQFRDENVAKIWRKINFFFRARAEKWRIKGPGNFGSLLLLHRGSQTLAGLFLLTEMEIRLAAVVVSVLRARKNAGRNFFVVGV